MEGVVASFKRATGSSPLIVQFSIMQKMQILQSKSYNLRGHSRGRFKTFREIILHFNEVQKARERPSKCSLI